MPEIKKIYQLFLSHPWRIGGEYDQLIRLLNQAPGFDWHNCSRPQCSPAIDPEASVWAKELMLALHGQIKPSGCVLILPGLYRSTPWIQIAINIAKYYAKPMLGILPQGVQFLPQTVKMAVKEAVPWDSLKITEAIKRYSL